jgi:hypothetical protein
MCSVWMCIVLCNVHVRSRSLESLVEGYNWFLNQFVEIPRRCIVVCFLTLSAKTGLKGQ